MVTSASDQYPTVITAVTEANVPSKAYYKFDDSVLYASTDNAKNEVTHCKNFAAIQKFLIVFSNMQHVNLELTINVIDSYMQLQLENGGKKLTNLVATADSKVEELKEEESKLQSYEDDIAKYKDFIYKEKFVRKIKLSDPSNKVVTFCTKCEYLCHESCGFDNNEEKYNCDCMDGGEAGSARCVKCPGRCHWFYHISRSFYYKEQEYTNTIINEGMKENIMQL